jgi:hypothetical protein
MQITFFDVVFLLALVGGAAWGFYRGFFRQAVGTVVLYISTVISTVGYRSLSRLLAGSSARPSPASDVVAFVALMGFTNLLLYLMGRDLIGHISIERMTIWVNLTGMIFGFINATIWCAVLLMVLRSSTSGEPWIGYEHIQAFFQSQTHNSWMAYVFRPFMRLMLAVLRPWMFGYDLPPLLVNSM